MITKRLLSEPLLHFAILGLALFVFYGFLNSDSDYAADEIVIDLQRQSVLKAEFKKVWQRSPTDEEFKNLIDSWIREEILYREGVALGFDRNDPVIRRRVAQKMSFVADGMVPEAPDDSALEAWLQANIDDYQIPTEYSLRQVYIDPQRHTDDFDVFANSIKKDLLDGADAKSLGDSTLLPAEISSSSSVELNRVFGSEFVIALAELSVGDWQGPIRSGYGLHFVKIDGYVAARKPQLEEVRAAVTRDLLSDKSQNIGEAFYTALRERYTVHIESPAQDD